MSNCPNCNSVIKEGAKFCFKCGAKIILDTKECPYCHYRNLSATNRYCTMCGQVLLESVCNQNVASNNHERALSINSLQAVDLGLSVFWATYNIGTNDITYYGDDFAWGDPTRKTIKSILSKWFSAAPKQSNICSTNYDMATHNWHRPWQLPTCDHFFELLEQCSWDTFFYKDKAFYKIVSYVNDNYILLPQDIKLWIGDRAYGETVRFFDAKTQSVIGIEYDPNKRFFVRPVALRR